MPKIHYNTNTKMFAYRKIVVSAALPKYNDEIHMRKHAEYKKHFLMEEIPSALLEKTVCVSTEDDVM